MDEPRKEATCDCLQRFSDMAKAQNPKSSLTRVKCRGCGKEFVTNAETDLCYDCRKRGA